MARLPVPGGDNGIWGDILNEYLRVAHKNDGTLKTVPIEHGGTGATSLEEAREKLGITTSGSSSATFGTPLYIQSTNPGTKTPHLWIQTGLGPHGSDMTFWVEDGH